MPPPQAYDEPRQGPALDSEHDGREHQFNSIILPQRGQSKAQFGRGGKLPTVNSESMQQAIIEHRTRRVAILEGDSGRAARRHGPQGEHGDVRGETLHAQRFAAERPLPDKRVEVAENRSRRMGRDFPQRLRPTPDFPFAVDKDRRVIDHGLVGQTGDPLSQRRHRQARQVDPLPLVWKREKLLIWRLIEWLAAYIARDKRDATGFWKELTGDRQSFRQMEVVMHNSRTIRRKPQFPKSLRGNRREDDRNLRPHLRP